MELNGASGSCTYLASIFGAFWLLSRVNDIRGEGPQRAYQEEFFVILNDLGFITISARFAINSGGEEEGVSSRRVSKIFLHLSSMFYYFSASSSSSSFPFFPFCF